MNYCTKCKKEKDNKLFYYRKDRKCYHAWCKSCMATVGHDRYRERKQRVIKMFGGKCSVCGYCKNINALDFHHLNPKDKDRSWAELKNANWNKLMLELQKCILVCRNCHAEIHWPEKEVDCAADVNLNGPTKTGDCKYCGEPVYGTVFCSRNCVSAGRRKVKWPSRDELNDLMNRHSVVRIAKDFGVSDNAVRKWAKFYDIRGVV